MILELINFGKTSDKVSVASLGERKNIMAELLE